MRVKQPAERLVFERQRLAQLKERRVRVARMGDAVDGAIEKLSALSRGRHLDQMLLRRRFVYRDEPVPGQPSDRSLPPRLHRPPATRIMSPNGIALRLYLLGLFEGQAHARASKTPANQLPLIAGGGEIGWTDLIAVPFQTQKKAQHLSAPGGHGIKPRNRAVSSRNDKKKRRIVSALQALSGEDVGLVYLPGAGNATRKYERFQLLDEGGTRAHADPSPYVVPLRHDTGVFGLPAGLFTNGWIHLLEDSELTFLMMLADWTQNVQAQVDEVDIPGETRLLRYGVGWDAYEANMVLRQFGLIEVNEQERHEDGRIVGFTGETERHGLHLVTAGFDEPAVATIVQALA